MRNVFFNNTLTDIELSKVQISKMIQSVGFLCNILDNVSKKVITYQAIPIN